MIALLYLLIVFWGGKNWKEEIEDQTWGILEHPWICWIHLFLHCQWFWKNNIQLGVRVSDKWSEAFEKSMFKRLIDTYSRVLVSNRIDTRLGTDISKEARIIFYCYCLKTIENDLWIYYWNSYPRYVCSLELMGSHRYCSVGLLRFSK